LEHHLTLVEAASKRFSDAAAAPRGQQDEGPDSVVLLNIGGDRTLEVLRSTLQVVEGSHLADLFRDGWEHRLPRDAEGRVFIDCPADVFVPMVDYLREYRLAGGRMPPYPTFDRPDQAEAFSRMLRYYGLDRFLAGARVAEAVEAPPIAELGARDGGKQRGRPAPAPGPASQSSGRLLLN